MKHWVFGLWLLLGVVVAQAAGGSPPLTVPPDQRIIVCRHGADAAAVARRHAITADRVYGHVFRGFAGRIPATRLRQLAADPDVLLVERDLVAHHCAQTIPTGIKRIGADLNPIANINGKDERVNADVAVIDTGIDLTHPDLNVVFSKSFIQGVTSGQDQHGHGTHVAGIIAAIDNGSGVVGVAPGARLWALRVLDKNGSGYMSDVIHAIDYVAANADRIAVVNMSLGGVGRVDSFRLAIQNCVARGVLIVVAAGNDGQDVLGPDGVFETDDDSIPAAYPEVAAISALCDTDGKPGGLGRRASTGDLDDRLASWSNFSRVVPSGRPVASPGGAIDLAAPGVDIRSTYLKGGYATLSGTSMASPHAAGAAALYIAAHGRARDAAGVYAIRQALIAAAQPQTRWGPANTGDPDPHHEGLIYVGSTTTPPNTAPTVAITRPSNGSTFTTTDSIAFQATATDAQDGDLAANLTWTSSRDGTLGTGASLSRSLSLGTHTITASVTDSGGLAGAASVSVTVNPGNTAPTVAIASPKNGAAFLLSDAIPFKATATDKEDGSLAAKLAWTSSLDGSIGTGASFSRTLSAGKHTITASATDSGGLTAKASVAITVTSGGTGSPSLAVTVSPDRPVYYRRDTAFFTVEVADGANPVAGAAVTLNLLTPYGYWLSARGTTDASGSFMAYYNVWARYDGYGLYRLTATASKPGYTDGAGSATFLVP